MHPNETELNDYVDGALADADRAAVDRHLTTCVECRRLVDEVRELRRRVSSLEPLAPPARVWKRIERELRREAEAGATRRSFVSRYSPWLASAAVLIVCAAIAMRFLGVPWHRAAIGGAGDNRELAQSVESELLQAEQHYQKAIAGLEQIANAEKGALDPKTAATLQKNLSVIDQAIGESRAALKTQPNNEPAQQSLLESFKTKIALLQDTIALINEMRKGNDAGAAQIVSGVKQKS